MDRMDAYRDTHGDVSWRALAEGQALTVRSERPDPMPTPDPTPTPVPQPTPEPPSPAPTPPAPSPPPPMAGVSTG